jgi:hypothetical protein
VSEGTIHREGYAKLTSFHTTDNQLLQVKLGSNTHEHVHVQIVVVSDERLRGGATGNSIHQRSLNFSKVTAVEVLADVANNTGTGAKNLAGLLVHDKVKVTLTETLFDILEAVVLRGNCVQTRGQKNDLRSEDGKLAIITVLRISLADKSSHAHNVTSAEKLMLFLEGLASRVLGLAHHLDLDTFCANIIENQLGTSGTLSVDAATNANNDISLLFTLLETLVILQDVAQVGIDLEFVRVGVGLLGLAQRVDLLAPNLEVLLNTTLA